MLSTGCDILLRCFFRSFFGNWVRLQSEIYRHSLSSYTHMTVSSVSDLPAGFRSYRFLSAGAFRLLKNFRKHKTHVRTSHVRRTCYETTVPISFPNKCGLVIQPNTFCRTLYNTSLCVIGLQCSPFPQRNEKHHRRLVTLTLSQTDTNRISHPYAKSYSKVVILPRSLCSFRSTQTYSYVGMCNE